MLLQAGLRRIKQDPEARGKIALLKQAMTVRQGVRPDDVMVVRGTMMDIEHILENGRAAMC